MNNEIYRENLKVSRRSLISAAALIVGVVLYFLNFIVSASGYITKSQEPLLMILPLTLWITALVLGLTDIFKKDRRKILSIFIVIISGIPLILFLLVLIVMLVFGP